MVRIQVPQHMPHVVTLTPVKILYIPSKSGISGGEKAFTKLELKLKSMKGRKFYGLVFGSPPNETYWACIARNDSDQSLSDCKRGIIPGGTYVQERIYNWEQNLSSIGEAFSELIKTHNVDPDRPCIEFYHGMNYMIIRVPVRG